MPEYKAPLRDINFAMNEVLEAEQLLTGLPGYEEATEDLMNAIVEEGAKFAEQVLSPLNQSGDEEGCTWTDGEVKTPNGFPEAYHQYVENGWPALAAETEYGGQGMPNLLGIIVNELRYRQLVLGYVSGPVPRCDQDPGRTRRRPAEEHLPDQVG